MYNSLVLHHINYGILVWGHQAHRIFKLQKRAIRTITLSKYNAHTDHIYIKLKFLKLDDTTLKFINTTHVEEIICLFPEPHMNLQQSTLDTI